MNTRRVLLRVLKSEASRKPEGYLLACLRAGRIDGDYLELSEADFNRISRKHEAIGDKIHRLLRPWVLRFDARFGTQIATCSVCDGRRRKLNQWEAASAKLFRGLKRRYSGHPRRR